MSRQGSPFLHGERVVVRDAEWLVQRIDRCSDGAQQLTCDGVPERVRNQEGVFFTSLDIDFDVSDPAKTKLVRDDSLRFARSRPYVESQLRRSVPSDEESGSATRPRCDRPLTSFHGLPCPSSTIF